jgi:WD40 repeat protein
VTALKFFHGQTGRLLILAGEGCYLKVFDAQTSALICNWQVFKDQTIHGIAVRSNVEASDGLQVALWGGSYLMLLRKTHIEQLLSQDVSNITGLVHVSSDWILDVAISPFVDDSCVLVTAHNTVLRAIFGEEASTVILETLNSPSRSILYSAHLVWESPDCLLVAAGTVFGEVITWRCTPSAAKSSRILATFTGHEGSIFGVHISPSTLDAHGNITRLLASCSDDRTIRIWDIYGAAKLVTQLNDGSVSKAEYLRETGFGNNGQDDEVQNTVGNCVAMAMGHASRIWRVEFYISKTEDPKASRIHVLSFGEDSTAQQWTLDFESQFLSPVLNSEFPSASSNRLKPIQTPSQSAKLTHTDTFAYHSGKHIWSTAMKHHCDSSYIVTGGADGKISLYQLSKDTKRAKDASSSASWDLEKILESLPEVRFEEALIPDQPNVEPILDTLTPLENGKPPRKVKPKKRPKDSFNRYAFVQEGKILLTTTFGRVLLGNVGDSTNWRELSLPNSEKNDLKPYSVVKGIPYLGFTLLGGASGNLYLYRGTSRIQKIAEVEGKVADIFLLSDARSKPFNFVVTTLGTGLAIFFGIDVTDPATFNILEETVFHLPDKFVVTGLGVSENGIVLGSRNGSLAAYSSTGWDQPVAIWDREGGDAITSITSLPSSKSATSYFLTTGRNGIYSIFAMKTLAHAEKVIYPVHHGTPPLGPNIEAAWFEGSDLLLYGFKSKNFVVWNETQQREIMNVECGGAHRSYDYFPLKDGGGCFIYTKASRLYVHTRSEPSHKIIKPGGHGREIKACSVSPDQSLIATGAEDTSIRIWRYHDSLSPLEKRFEGVAVIQKHSAGIQSLQFLGSEYLFSSGGNEEFFVWALHSIPGFGVGVVCEASCPDQSEERDLRIMGFDVSKITAAEEGDTAPQLLISLAYSDSTLRTYRYSKAEGFSLLAKGRYTSSCLMHVRHVKISRDEVHLLTAATDGSLVIWKTASLISSDQDRSTSNQLVKLATHKLHQSTIKCLDSHQFTSKNKIVIATGGDDNALGVTIYSSDDFSQTPTSIILRSAHAAAVTGLTLITDALGGNLRIVSSSNDQRIKEWDVSIGDDNAIEFRKVGDVFTSVADVGDVAPLGNGVSDRGEKGGKKVLVVGNGMEVFAISSKR